eukprot:TRINITY_DN6193_c0_g1_i1.p1 TRINITY_DN6193_c0_g1~~TRINITY_DN6193_c0_g1_i1.p1  ORF type:complete len:253 (+),score=52.61 TRINITY_DN6193_c0_g1_i1:72-761(+)
MGDAPQRHLRRPELDATGATPTQPQGPFQYPTGHATWKDDDSMAAHGAKGKRIQIRGVVTGTDRRPVPGALLELWQATSTGKYPHPKDVNTRGVLDPALHHYIRVRTDAHGVYSFSTIKPGGYPVPLGNGREWRRPSHIHYRVTADGFTQLVTQLYFEEEGDENDRDELQRLLTPEQRRQLRIDLSPSGEGCFNVVLSESGYPGVGIHVRPWDMGLEVGSQYQSATAKL